MTDRVELFKAAYPNWPAAWPTLVKEDGHDVLYATWCLGAQYGNDTPYYGSYPRGYLTRIAALFPTPPRTLRDRRVPVVDVLHVFSGSLPASPAYVRLDSNRDLGADVTGSVYDVERLFLGARRFRLLLADPPYSAADAEKYATPMVDRGRATVALAGVTKPGGHLVWLDVCWPMHRKAQWRTVGRITIIRSTNHRVRCATIFERVA